jgi:hypothetical protein
LISSAKGRLGPIQTSLLLPKFPVSAVIFRREEVS